MRMIDPPAKPKCEGTDPEYFDNPALFYTALKVCRGCPVRMWCLQRVDPAKSHYDGVAGGHAWKDGHVVSRWDTDPDDPVVELYLESRKRTRRDTEQLPITLFDTTDDDY